MSNVVSLMAVRKKLKQKPEREQRVKRLLDLRNFHNRGNAFTEVFIPAFVSLPVPDRTAFLVLAGLHGNIIDRWSDNIPVPRSTAIVACKALQMYMVRKQFDIIMPAPEMFQARAHNHIRAIFRMRMALPDERL